MTQRGGPEQAGFSRVEFLVVFVVIGILAAIVVFSGSGLKAEGRSAACRTGLSSIVKAEETFSASQAGGRYTDMSGLVGAGILDKSSTLYSVAANNTVDPKRYTISPIGTTCPAIP